MVDTYYTNEMKHFVAELPNRYGFPVTIHLMSDHDGDYLALAFDNEEYERYKAMNIMSEVAEYLVSLRNGLINLGARVTFFITSEGNNDEKTG